jgi:hypothetical protein
VSEWAGVSPKNMEKEGEVDFSSAFSCRMKSGTPSKKLAGWTFHSSARPAFCLASPRRYQPHAVNLCASPPASRSLLRILS